MINLLDNLRKYVESRGLSPELARVLTGLGGLAVIALITFIIAYISNSYFLKWIKNFMRMSKVKWDGVFLKRKVPDKLARLVPAFVFFALSEHFLINYPLLRKFLTHSSFIYIVIIMVIALDAALDVLLDVCNRFKFSKTFPIKSFIQVMKVALYITGGVLVIATVIGESPVYILSGMGALTAVMMLVFKDPILGLVAGIQLTQNNMIQIGDWIEMPKYGANGGVIDLALTTVKVENWDNTVTTIPTYALISDSFKNWRYMSDSGGRRIMRAFYIDMTSVKFCSEEMLRRFSKVRYIAAHIESKKAEIKKYNEKHNLDLESLANGRRLTNLGVLRAYMVAYLRNHPMINKDLTLMVRQLEPTPDGLPIQVYCFCADKVWVNYEGVQSDIYDHFIAVLSVFDLRVFQRPSGYDFSEKNQKFMG